MNITNIIQNSTFSRCCFLCHINMFDTQVSKRWGSAEIRVKMGHSLEFVSITRPFAVFIGI